MKKLSITALILTLLISLIVSAVPVQAANNGTGHADEAGIWLNGEYYGRGLPSYLNLKRGELHKSVTIPAGGRYEEQLKVPAEKKQILVIKHKTAQNQYQTPLGCLSYSITNSIVTPWTIQDNMPLNTDTYYYSPLTLIHFETFNGYQFSWYSTVIYNYSSVAVDVEIEIYSLYN